MAPEARRAQIVAAAGALISERGFWGTSVQDVADACGLTVAGLLHHVGSKDGLLVAVLQHRDEADIRALMRELGLALDDETPRGVEDVDLRGVSLARLCEALVRRNATQPEIVRLYSVLEAESLDAEHPAHAYFTARQRSVLEAFATAAPPTVADPDALARHVLAAMDGLQLQWLREPSVDLVAAWATIARSVDGLAEPSA
ncbi:TetR/AcrR family transcriptional regulator [Cellulomonas endometrii]|uniref:TetR/AcrR family transcriptional regulator n=1 Tax=Cellulomonas endometrii TaxID=3036301 RepID=UPI0024ACA2B2|nr:helix-turn-helix domain-containing protein [Cellulomonas endometrii]